MDAFIELPSIIGNTILAQPLLVTFFPMACHKLVSLSKVAAFATRSRKIPGRNTEALKGLCFIIGNTRSLHSLSSSHVFHWIFVKLRFVFSW